MSQSNTGQASDNGTHLRGEKHEGGGGVGLLVQGVDLLHRERSQKCPRATRVKSSPSCRDPNSRDQDFHPAGSDQNAQEVRPGRQDPHRSGRVPSGGDR